MNRDLLGAARAARAAGGARAVTGFVGHLDGGGAVGLLSQAVAACLEALRLGERRQGVPATRHLDELRLAMLRGRARTTRRRDEVELAVRVLRSQLTGDEVALPLPRDGVPLRIRRLLVDLVELDHVLRHATRTVSAA